MLLYKMVTMVVLGETTTDGWSLVKEREYWNVRFPSKYISGNAVTLKQTILLTLSNGPMMVERSEVSRV